MSSSPRMVTLAYCLLISTAVALLRYVKELMFVDPDDNLPLETIVGFYNHEIVAVWYVTQLCLLPHGFLRAYSWYYVCSGMIQNWTTCWLNSSVVEHTW